MREYNRIKEYIFDFISLIYTNSNSMTKMEEVEQSNFNVDWKKYIDIHFPNIGKIYLEPAQMIEVNRKLAIRNLNVEKTKGSYDTTIYDHLILVIVPGVPMTRRKNIAWSLLHFLDQMVGEFIVLTNNDADLLRQLKKQMEDLFRDNNAQYLERVGELLSTIHLIKTLAPAKATSLKHYYEIKNGRIDTNGKDADLHLRDSTGKEFLIDIFNVNLDHELIETEDGLRKILTSRIRNKYLKKKFDNPVLHERYLVIKIQPFIWVYSHEKIREFRHVLAEFNMVESLPILMMEQSVNADGRIIYNSSLL